MEDPYPEYELAPIEKEFAKLGEDLHDWLDQIPRGIMFLGLEKDEILIVHTAILILKRESVKLRMQEIPQMTMGRAPE